MQSSDTQQMICSFLNIFKTEENHYNIIIELIIVFNYRIDYRMMKAQMRDYLLQDY